MQYRFAISIALNVAYASSSPRPTIGSDLFLSPRPLSGGALPPSPGPHGRDCTPFTTHQLGGGGTAQGTTLTAFSSSSCVSYSEHPAEVFNRNIMAALAADIEDRILANDSIPGGAADQLSSRREEVSVPCGHSTTKGRLTYTARHMAR